MHLECDGVCQKPGGLYPRTGPLAGPAFGQWIVSNPGGRANWDAAAAAGAQSRRPGADRRGPIRLKSKRARKESAKERGYALASAWPCRAPP